MISQSVRETVELLQQATVATNIAISAQACDLSSDIHNMNNKATSISDILNHIAHLCVGSKHNVQELKASLLLWNQLKFLFAPSSGISMTSDIEVTISCCKVIRYMCNSSLDDKCVETVNSDVMRSFQEIGAGDEVVAAMEKFMAAEQAVKWCCIAIQNLAFVESTAKELGQCGACEAVMKALVYHIHNPEIVYEIVYVIGSLSCDGNGDSEIQLKFLSLNVIELLIIVLQDNIKHAEIVEFSTYALCHLSFRCDAVRVALQPHPICELILLAIDTHLQNAYIIENSCCVIGHLSFFLIFLE